MQNRRATWWMPARTVPGTIAALCYAVSMGLFFVDPLSSRLRTPAFWSWFRDAMLALIFLIVVLGVQAIRCLRSRPELVRQPAGRPLSAHAARRLYALAAVAVAVSVVSFGAAIVTGQPLYRFVNLLGFMATAAVQLVFQRRPVAKAWSSTLALDRHDPARRHGRDAP